MSGWRTRRVATKEVTAPPAGLAPTAIEVDHRGPSGHVLSAASEVDDRGPSEQTTSAASEVGVLESSEQTTSAAFEVDDRGSSEHVLPAASEVGVLESRRASRWSGILIIVVIMTASVLALGLGRRPAVSMISAGGCDWRSPVDALVVDPFRRPGHRYGPGNRGLEYGAATGTAVRAVADGVVRFAGPVGGRYYVVIEHGGELLSTYGPMRSVVVVRGQSIDQATGLGLASAGFHLTARLGGRYIDPKPLLDGRCGRARLVPVHSVPATRSSDPSVNSMPLSLPDPPIVPPRVR